MPPVSSSRSSNAPACPTVELRSRKNVSQRPAPRSPSTWPLESGRSNDAAVKSVSSGSVTKRIVSDVVTSCCLSAVPESDLGSSTCDEEITAAAGPAAAVRLTVVATREKGVMTDDAFSPDWSTRPARQSAESRPPLPRNSCPLSPPSDGLCECEKRALSRNDDDDDGGGENATGRLLYRNGNSETPLPAASLLQKALALNEQHRRHRVDAAIRRHRPTIVDAVSVLGGLPGGCAALGGAAHDSARRCGSDDARRGRRSDASVAECAKCGIIFDVRAGTFFSGPSFENLSSTSSMSETSSSSTSTSASTSTSPSNPSGTGDPRSSSTSSAAGCTPRDTTQPPRSADADKDDELTIEERESILKRLEQIVTGDLSSATEPLAGRSVKSSPSFTSSMLHLDLNSLRSGSGSESDDGYPLVEGRCRSLSGASVGAECRLGRVAELTRLFSGLGEAGIIKARSRTTSTPNIGGGGGGGGGGGDDDDDSMNVISRIHQRSVSVEGLVGDVSPAAEVPVVSTAPSRTIRRSPPQCRKRGHSFVRADTVLCKVSSVDELDRKRRRRQNRVHLYKYASVSDLRLLAQRRQSRQMGGGGIVHSIVPAKIVSFQDVDVKKLDGRSERAPRAGTLTVDGSTQPTFCASSPPRNDEALSVDYDRITSAMRNYLANRELLRERMKSNIVDRSDGGSGEMGARNGGSHRAGCDAVSSGDGGGPSGGGTNATGPRKVAAAAAAAANASDGTPTATDRRRLADNIDVGSMRVAAVLCGGPNQSS